MRKTINLKDYENVTLDDIEKAVARHSSFLKNKSKLYICTVPFYYKTIQPIYNLYDEKFFDNRMSKFEYMELCDKLFNYSQINRLTASKKPKLYYIGKILKICLIVVILGMITALIGIKAVTSTTNSLFYCGLIIGAIAASITFICGLIAFFDKPSLEKCVSSVSKEISAYIDELNKFYRQRGLKFFFHIEIKNLEITKKSV